MRTAEVQSGDVSELPGPRTHLIQTAFDTPTASRYISASKSTFQPDMEGWLVAQSQRVFVVDDISETADVLRAVLEPRGVVVNHLRASRPTPDEPAPSVLVIDTDTNQVPAPHAANWLHVPRVIIGRIDASQSASPVGGRHFSKPFEYADLVRAVEDLIHDE